MTEQRKNKQRLGFLGPPQPNHHIPAHWGAWASIRTQWWATRLQEKPDRNADTHTNSSLKNNICILCMPTITEVKRASKCWHIIFDIVPYLWHNHCLMGDKLCPFSRSEHFFTACLYTPSVNDWPCTAHICQCSVSVPDRSRVMLK